MKAIKIDVVKQEVYFVTIKASNTLPDIYRELECDTFDIVHIAPGNDLYVDDNGLLVDEPLGAFTFKGRPEGVFSGHGLILGCDDSGESRSCQLQLETMVQNVLFVDLLLLPKPSMTFIPYD